MNNKSPLKDIICILVIVSFFVFLFFHLGVIYNGYRLSDDHEIFFLMQKYNNGEHFFNMFFEMLNTEGRFRPIYWIHRLFIIKLFGTNFFLYYLEYFFMGVITSCCLYQTLKNLFGTQYENVLIIALLFIGEGLDLFFWLGHGEIFSLTLLTLSLFFMSLKPIKHKKTFDILSFIFLTLMMFSRETFLLATPFILLFKIFCDSENSNYKISLKQNRLYIFSSIILFTICVLLNYKLSQMIPSYSFGLDFSYIIKRLKFLFFNEMSGIYFSELAVILSISILGILTIKVKKSDEVSKNDFKKVLLFVALSLLFILSQTLFLAAMSEDNKVSTRYFYPAFLGYSFILVSVIPFFKKYENILYGIYLTIITVLIYFNYYFFNYYIIDYYIKANRDFNKNLNIVKNNISSNDIILIIGDSKYDFESFESLARYFDYYGFKNLYIFYYSEQKYSSLNDFEKNMVKFLDMRFRDNLYKNMKGIPKVILFFNEHNIDINKKGFDINIDNSYKKINEVKYYNLDFYIKKL